MATTFGRYVLVRSIAFGGMGEVYLARQTGPDGFERECVVKTMHQNLSDDPEVVEMFLEEARLTARLTHPHIAQVYDFGKVDGVYFLALERVDGPSLYGVVRSYISRGRLLPVGPVLRMVSQAAQALDYVHRVKGPDGGALGLVHRDISPGNLLLSRDGLVKVIDFGIAKARTTARKTRMGEIRGKLAYMSPEQLLGSPLDGRTDVYSLGLVLYELLSGRRANPGRNEVEVMNSVRSGALTPIAELRTDLPPSLPGVLERALARDRDRRFGRAADFGASLEAALAEAHLVVEPADLSEVAEQAAAGSPQDSISTRAQRAPSASEASASSTTGSPASPPSASASGTPDAPSTSGQLMPVAPAEQAIAPRPFPAKLWALGALVVALGAGVGVLLFGLVLRTPNSGPSAAASPGFVSAAPATEPPAPAPPSEEGPGSAHAEHLVAAAIPVAPPEQIAEHAPVEERAPVKVPSEKVPSEKVRPKSTSAMSKSSRPEPPGPSAMPSAPVLTASLGTLDVSSDPATEIWVDGRARGITPSRIELPEGAHQLELRESRLGLRWKKPFAIEAQKVVSLQWRPEHGTIDVRPVPPHVEMQIAVDGIAVGPTPISAFSVYEGSRRVTALNTSTGWQTEKTVEVRPSARLRLKVIDGTGIELASP